MSISSVAGVDLSKDSFYAVLATLHDVLAPPRSFPYNEQGLADFFAFLKAHHVTDVAFESTGGYERHFFYAVSDAGLSAYQLEPLSVQQLARSFKKAEKTDKLDCYKIAQAALIHQPKPSFCPSKAQRDLRQVYDFRAQLLTTFKTLKNQIEKRDHEANSSTQQWFEQQQTELLDQLQAQIKAAEKMLVELIKQDETLSQTAKLLGSMPGIGPVSTWALLAKMPELGNLSRRACAKLAGLAPLCNQSGKRELAARTQPSRLALKAVLWMASLSAARVEGPFKDFYKKLVDSGKHPSVARVALMRRMLCMLNAMVRDGEEYSVGMTRPRTKEEQREHARSVQAAAQAAAASEPPADASAQRPQPAAKHEEAMPISTPSAQATPSKSLQNKTSSRSKKSLPKAPQ